MTAGFDPPPALALMLYVPWLLLAVKAEDVATPLALVLATHW